MDGDPAVEPELDSFSLTLPLPYRVALIIDVPTLIRYTRTSGSLPPHHFSIYRLATILTISLASSLLLFWAFTHRSPTLVVAYDWLPISYLFLLAIFFFLPWQRLSQNGRYRFLSTLKRVSIGGIATAKDGKFGDILLADVLTSYAKVLGDLFVSLCMFFSSGGSATRKPNRNCGGQFIVPFIIAVPSLIRLRQCLIEYGRARHEYGRIGLSSGSGWGGQHLANAAKYASAFPVIILSALQRSLSFDEASVGMSAAAVYRLWLAAVLLNSLYSFYWDVARDWDLTLFSSARTDPDHPWGLRRRMYFQSNEVYYLAIALDLVLRCTWSLKLSPHLDHFNDLEGGIFAMEFLEVLRRWVWIFFRVETEWVRHASTGLDPDDILLGDYQGKDDDE
ncbi:MAG: protein-ER retention protein [Claussenomyces sp. TS43310]|nr:MAG: protein-ER retention protein [Claussenomyces sp. TS43310]